MRFFVILLSLFVLALPTYAQSAAPAADTVQSGDASVDTLIKILENDDSRAALIDRLRQAEPSAVAATPVEAAPPDLSIARQLAEYTKSVAEGTAATFAALGRAVTDLRDGLSGASNADFSQFQQIALNVLLVAVGLFGGFWVLRVLVFWSQRAIANRVEQRPWYIRGMGALGAAAVDTGSVAIAWAIGYAIALGLIGYTSGRMGINQSLLLNAFLVVELIKLLVRTVLSPRYRSLRLLPVGDSNAAYWSFWIARIVSLIGYTFMFVAPVLAANLSPGAANAVKALVMLTATAIGIVIVLQNKQDVKVWLTGLAGKRANDGFGRVLLAIGQFWHLVAIAYLLALLVVWFANPDEALPFMLGATVQSLIAILVGTAIVAFIGRFVGVGFHLPGDIRARLPLLEARIKAFVPRVMQIVRWVVLVGVVIAILQAWALFDFLGWISSEGGQQVAGSVISAALIILICIVLHIVVASWVEYRLNTKVGKAPTAREKTLLGLFKNAFTIALLVFGVMLALAQIGVNIAPLLAGAGVIGLAIGFGAQKLVQDIITGIFIQFENVMNEGDVVEAAGKAGVVEKLTIRSVTIRDMSGTVHLIPFSSVDLVSNMVRGFSFYVAEFEVAGDSDVDAVKQAMRDAFAVVIESEHKDVILDNLDPPAMIAATPISISFRSRIKTIAGKQWGPGRLYSETVRRLFAERGIAYPKQQITYQQGAGNRPPMLPPGDSDAPTQA